MTSDNVKTLYNQYLRISRTSKGLPFKYRSNFENFYETEQFVCIKKIERILQNNPSIKAEEFFTAPFNLYPNETFSLSFFTSLKAVKTYSIYMKKLLSSQLDGEYHLRTLAESLKIIRLICIENKINVKDVPRLTTKGLAPDWMILLKNREINPFVMFGFSNLKQILDSLDKQAIQLIIPDFYTDYYSNLSKFNNSSKAKILVDKGLKLIQKQINNQLN